MPEYFDMLITEELFDTLKEECPYEYPTDLNKTDMYLVFWRETQAFSTANFYGGLFKLASRPFGSKVIFINPHYDQVSSTFVRNGDYMNNTWVARRAL